MKIRTGFVSNSSSSSFVLIVREEDHIKALDALDDYGKKFIEELMKRWNVGGMNVRTAFCYDGEAHHDFQFIKVNKDEKEKDWDLLDKKKEIYDDYVTALKRSGAKIFDEFLSC